MIFLGQPPDVFGPQVPNGGNDGFTIPDFIPVVGGRDISTETAQSGLDFLERLLPGSGSRTSQDPPRPGPSDRGPAIPPSVIPSSSGGGGLAISGILPLLALGVGVFLLFRK